MNLNPKIQNINALIKELGFGLVIVRSPRVIIRTLRTQCATWYWSLFLGSMGKNVKIFPGVVIHKPRMVFIGNNVIISEGTNIGSESTTGRLIIQDYVQVNRLCFIDHSGDTVIGEGTLISEGVSILSHSHGYDPKQPSVGIPKSIGKKCWIGFRAIVGEKATYIAEHVIIASAAVVTKPCEQPDSIYGGFPAKWLKSIQDET